MTKSSHYLLIKGGIKISNSLSDRSSKSSRGDEGVRKALKTPLVEELSYLFKKAEKNLYLVGGSVRDALLGEVHKDLDFATDALPEEIIGIIKEWADAIWTVGIKFGTVGLTKEGHKAEITTLREEVYFEGDRRPQVKFSTDIKIDLSRRDFTINAIAFKVPKGELIDPFGGQEDLKRRILKTPLEPEQSFLDDPLRMLRACRFAATLVVNPSSEVIEAMKSLKDRLKIVSKERIREELSLMLVGLAPILGLKLMVETSLTEYVIPELPRLKIGQDSPYHHKDVLEHTYQVVEGVERDLALRLAALFHDIGKPYCCTVVEEEIHFYQHELVGARIARKQLRKLRYPKEIIKEVTQLIRLHMRAYTYGMGWTDKAVRRYVRDAGPYLEKLNSLAKADCTTRIPAKAEHNLKLMQELEERIVRLEAEEESAKIRPPLNGHEVMEFLKISPGPLIGEALAILLEARLEGTLQSKKDAYKFLEEWAKKKELL